MRLRQILNEVAQKMISEGGNAFEGVGTVHVSEIPATLQRIEQQVGLSDVNGRALGSVGKKEYSGDIDLAVEPKSPEELVAFIEQLEQVYGKENVRKIGSIVTTKVKIEDFDASKDERQPRTGFVQVDYMFDNPEWLKFFYHSPNEGDSKFKGTHRNLAIAAIASQMDREDSEEEDGYGRPVETQRWMWSPKEGLAKVRRTSHKDKRTGTKWVKAQKTEKLNKPTQNPAEIANAVFKGKAGPEAFDSTETLIAAVKKAYDKKQQEAIFQQMAHNFETHADVGNKEWDYPKEISKYLGKE